MASIRFQDICKDFSPSQTALRGIDLEVAEGELVVLVGPSGCGKSTLLRIVAGLDMPSRGRVFLDGTDVTELPPQKRDVALVFQNYALYPHMSVRDNLAFGLRMRGADAAEIADRVGRAAATLGIDALLDRRPAQLSGGQRQRVALGRALVRRPRVFLLDEPLSNLDARLRLRTRAEIARIHRNLGATMLYVTHDQEEAMTLGDRVAVMSDGRILQVGRPLEIYTRPATSFVAEFIGATPMNFFAGSLRRGAEGPIFRSGSLSVRIAGWPGSLREEGDVRLGIRPEDLEVVGPDQADAAGRVDIIESLGSDLLLHVQLEDEGEATEVILRVPSRMSVEPGATLGLHLRRDRLHLFDAITGDRLDPGGHETGAPR